MLTNQSQMSYNDTNENRSNNIFGSAILTGSEAGPSNAITYKRVNKSNPQSYILMLLLQMPARIE